MKTSIVMTTFNGEKYILEQLISLQHQTVKADEVLIFDDCSNDRTPQIITKFINDNCLYKWIFSINARNLGWKKNFMIGFNKAKGDVILPCDQDDIWALDKIEKMILIMKNNKNILLLVSNYTTLYEERNVRKISSKITNSMKEDGKLEKIMYSRYFMSVLRPGCTYCFRKQLLNLSNNVWQNDFPHDATLWRLASLLDGLYLYSEKLINFRRYNTSNSNPDRLATGNKNKLFADSLYLYENVINNVLVPDLNQLYVLKEYINTINLQNKSLKLDTIKTIIDYSQLRLKMFKQKNIIIWFFLQIKYNKCYYTNMEKLGDLYILIGTKLYKIISKINK
jgi:glycosyltransferase involved in cell wall biosynthesis